MTLQEPLRAENPFRSAPLRAATTAVTAPSVVPVERRLRPMTGWEEEFVELHGADPNTAGLVNQVLARCLVPPGADATAALQEVRRLTTADRNRALLVLRHLSLGPEITAEAACPVCGATTSVAFRLDTLPPGGPAPEAPLRIMTPGAGPAELRLPDAGDQEALLDAPLATRAARVTWLLARTLLHLGDRAGPFAAEDVHALPVADRTALEAALEAATPRFDLAMSVTCGACSHAFEAPFDVQAFFLPK